MVTETVTLLLREEPEVPVTTMLKVPSGALLLAATVKVVEVVLPDGLKLALTPLGAPDAEKPTCALKPF